jgi:hypothetical protein
MNVLDNPNSYKKLYENLDNFFTEQQNIKNKNDQNRSIDTSLSNDLEDYKKLNNTRIEKMYKLFEINTQNDKNDKEVLEKIREEIALYKSLNDGRVDKLAKLFLLLNKKS